MTEQLLTTEGKPLKVVLVHGTWGRGLLFKRAKHDPRLWFSPESNFSERLLAALKAHGFSANITSHHWSGANSFKHRSRAAEELARGLHTSLQDEDTHHLLIAHSHGGNILMRMMHFLVARGLKPADQQRVNLVTIATPFIDLSHRRSKKVEHVALWLLVIAAVFLIVKLALPLVADAHFVIQDIAFRVLVSSSFMMIVYIIFGQLVFDAELDIDGSSRHFRETIEAAHYSGREFHSHCFVIRGYDDEAALVIGLGNVGNRLSKMAFSAIAFTIPVLLLLHFLQDFTEWGGVCRPVTMDGNSGSSDCSETYFWNLLQILAALLYGILALAAIFKSAFGRELVIGGWFANVVCNSVPDLCRNFSVKTLLPTRRIALKHSLYGHPHIARDIAKWLQSSLKAKKADSTATNSWAL